MHVELRSVRVINQFDKVLPTLPAYLKEQVHMADNETVDILVHGLHGKKYFHHLNLA